MRPNTGRRLGVAGTLANPKLQIFRGSTLVTENDDWSNNAEVSALGATVGAFQLAAGSRDAALIATLAPGAYTAVVTGIGGNGVVLMEVYDGSEGATVAAQQLVNLSTRGYVEVGDGALIAGFVVRGNTPKKLLIRGIGPGLTQFGVAGALANPAMRVVDSSSGEVVAQNDDWGTPQPVNATQMAATAAELAAASTGVGAFPLPAASRDAALILSLPPGSYTAVVSGAANTTGAALVEIYEVREP